MLPAESGRHRCTLTSDLGMPSYALVVFEGLMGVSCRPLMALIRCPSEVMPYFRGSSCLSLDNSLPKLPTISNKNHCTKSRNHCKTTITGKKKNKHSSFFYCKTKKQQEQQRQQKPQWEKTRNATGKNLEEKEKQLEKKTEEKQEKNKKSGKKHKKKIWKKHWKKTQEKNP